MQIANPQYVVIGLGNTDPGPVAAEMRTEGLPVAAQASTPFYFGGSLSQVEWALKAALFFDPGLCKGSGTVPVVVLPSGQAGPAGSTTFHDLLSGPVSGTLPFVGVPGTLTPAQDGPGLLFDTAAVVDGYYQSDPAGKPPFAPGPDDPSQLKAPDPFLGDLVFLWLAQQVQGGQ